MVHDGRFTFVMVMLPNIVFSVVGISPHLINTLDGAMTNG